MTNSMLLGIYRFMIPIPRLIWKGQLPGKAKQLTADLIFMTEHHHMVRNYVVRELPREGKKLSPESIAQNVNLPVTKVNAILDDLEEHKIFLFRDEQGNVSWAYPCTVEETPHHVAFDNGEETYAA